jgi:two-component system chemotaxis response regulator CheY
VRVLIAEDNKAVAGTLAAMLDVSHHEVVQMVGSGLEAIHAYQRHKPDVVMMDYMMDGLNGVTACRNILAKDPGARIILVSGALDSRELTLVRSGAWAIMQKPVTFEQLEYLLASLAPPPFPLLPDPSIDEEPLDFANPSRFF